MYKRDECEISFDHETRNLMKTRRILDILYSAQHENQHKDTFT